MDEETNPQAEVESEEIEPVETEEVEIEAAEVDDEAEETDESEEEESEEEVDYEGKKYRVPKELKDALLRNADYTRKTQEVAEARKALDAEKQQIQQVVQRQQQNLRDYAQLAAIDQQLQHLQGVDWNKLSDDDPVAAQKQFFHFQQLQQYRQSVAQSLTQREQQTLHEQQAQLAKQLEQGRQTLAKEIKDWSPELATKLVDFGTQLGFSREEMQSIADPRAVKLIHKAYLYDQAQAKAKQVAKPKPEQAKPVAKVSGKSASSSVNPERMTTEQWMRFRQKQIRAG